MRLIPNTEIHYNTDYLSVRCVKYLTILRWVYVIQYLIRFFSGWSQFRHLRIARVAYPSSCGERLVHSHGFDHSGNEESRSRDQARSGPTWLYKTEICQHF